MKLNEYIKANFPEIELHKDITESVLNMKVLYFQDFHKNGAFEYYSIILDQTSFVRGTQRDHQWEVSIKSMKNGCKAYLKTGKVSPTMEQIKAYVPYEKIEG